MLLIASEPAPADAPPTSPEDMKPWFDYDALLHEKGVYVDGAPLHGPETATTIRVRDGETVTTDGPFAATKEVLGGYYIIDCRDLDEATHYAALCPAAHYGSLEVRPVMDMSELPDPG
jgi:hypothetical protein